MRNYKIATPLSLTFLVVLSIMAGLLGILFSANATVKQTTPKEIKQQNNPYAHADISTNIIPAANKTFSYDILLSGKPLVHQPNIPDLPGNYGFTTKEKAQKVADFIVKKIKNNEMPPTVTLEDLNKMGMLK